MFTPKISNLWGIAIINKDEILVTQRSGNLYRLNVFNKNISKIEGAPKVYNSGQGGLLDIVFEKENEIYFKYSPVKKFKKVSIKKVSKENPFEVLKNLNLR